MNNSIEDIKLIKETILKAIRLCELEYTIMWEFEDFVTNLEKYFDVTYTYEYYTRAT